MVVEVGSTTALGMCDEAERIAREISWEKVVGEVDEEDEDVVVVVVVVEEVRRVVGVGRVRVGDILDFVSCW